MIRSLLLFAFCALVCGCAREDVDEMSPLCKELDAWEKKLQTYSFEQVENLVNEDFRRIAAGETRDSRQKVVLTLTYLEFLDRCDMKMHPTRSDETHWEILEDGSLTTTSGVYGDVVIPNQVNGVSVKHLCESIAIENKFLRSVVISEGIESMQTSSFYGCSIRTLKLPSTLKRVESGSFYSCPALRSVFFAEGIEEIGDDCFRYCHSLEKIVLPSTLKKLGKNCFADCPNLKEIRYRDGRVLQRENEAQR